MVENQTVPKIHKNLTMPELVNISVGSLPGTSELEGTTVWPLDAKKSRKVLRMSATDMTGASGAVDVGVDVLMFCQLGPPAANTTWRPARQKD
jgi:hypothetical protein